MYTKTFERNDLELGFSNFTYTETLNNMNAEFLPKQKLDKNVAPKRVVDH